MSRNKSVKNGNSVIDHYGFKKEIKNRLNIGSQNRLAFDSMSERFKNNIIEDQKRFLSEKKTKKVNKSIDLSENELSSSNLPNLKIS